MNKREKWLKQYEQNREQWFNDHHRWLDGIRKMKRCEQRVMGLIFEMEGSIPSHQIQTNQLQDMVIDHEKYLIKLAENIPCRNEFIDERCPSELANFKQLGMSRCKACEPKCFDALQEEYGKAAERHEMVAGKISQIEAEFEKAMRRMNRLVKDLEKSL